MYRHESGSCGPYGVIRHFRETTQASGLIAVEEIGHTAAIVRKQEKATSQNGLLMAGDLDIQHVRDTRSDSSFDMTDGISHEPSFESLDEFVAEGKNRMQKIVNSLREVVRVELHLEEIHRQIEEQTTSGIVIAKESPETEFVRYVASPDEIEALEQIAHGVVIPQTTENSSVHATYL